jgi:hypothetical protein
VTSVNRVQDPDYAARVERSFARQVIKSGRILTTVAQAEVHAEAKGECRLVALIATLMTLEGRGGIADRPPAPARRWSVESLRGRASAALAATGDLPHRTGPASA